MEKLKKTIIVILSYILCGISIIIIGYIVFGYGKIKFNNICLNPKNYSFVPFLITIPDPEIGNPSEIMPSSQKCKDRVNKYMISKNFSGFALTANVAKKLNQYNSSCDKYCYFNLSIVNYQVRQGRFNGVFETWNGRVTSFQYNNEILLKYKNNFVANVGDQNIEFSCSAIDCSLEHIKSNNRDYLLVNFKNLNSLENSNLNSNNSYIILKK